jgi:peptidoglycan/xylan/chitin deacetylase (PgdA/CDA1 family)
MKPKVKKWLIRGALLGIASGSIYLCLLPRLLPHQLSWWRPDICFRGNADRKRLYLTIDDGPSDETPAILAVLKKHNVPATFFVIGSFVQSDAQLRSIVEAGHSLGHHMRTWEPCASMSFDRFCTDFEAADQLLRRYSTPQYFRPPSASSTTRQIAYVRSKGYRPVLGTVFPFDHSIHRPWILRLLIRWLATPGGIIIMHDSDGRGRTTAQVLDAVLPALQRAGYEFDALASMMPGKGLRSTNASSDVLR